MFQFPSLPPVPYVFRYGYRRITSGEFPHSEIPGSKTGQRLPQAYRSRPRPSSALSAKASTVCPCSLDQKNTGNRCRYGVFKVRASSAVPPCMRKNAAFAFLQAEPVSQNSAAYDHARRGRRNSRRAGCPDGLDEAIDGAGAYRHEVPDSLERR